MKEERIDDVRNIVNFENYNMAEPKYAMLLEGSQALLFPFQGKIIEY